MSNLNIQQQFTLEDVDVWVEGGLITPVQATAIRRFVESAGAVVEPRPAIEQRRGLNLITVAYYFGSFMILPAYTIFVGLWWEEIGAYGQMGIAAFSIAVLWGLGWLLRRGGFERAGGLLIFAGTGIIPLLVYTIQRSFGLMPSPSFGSPTPNAYRDFYRWISSSWVIMEVVSIAVAVIALRLTHFSLISLLVAFWLWFFAMDITGFVTADYYGGWNITFQIVSVAMGLGMLALGILLQRMARRDYSFWFYLFGHLLIGFNLTSLTLEREGWLSVVYLLTYLTFVLGSVILQRRVFLVFGALGCYGYLCYLAYRVFDDAMGYSFGLAVVGLTIVLTAVGYQKYARPWLEKNLRAYTLTNQANHQLPQ